MKNYFFENALLSDGWASNVEIKIADTGEITTIRKNLEQTPKKTFIKGYAIPGIINTHSHAFQRAMAGLTEIRSKNHDNFWSWRELMFQFANIIEPQDLYIIASQLYIEMLKAGYTRVGEFHYLHHRISGDLYDNPAEMSYMIKQAAIETGIGLSILPVLYMQANFDRSVLNSTQLRFKHTLDSFYYLLEKLQNDFKEDKNVNIGVAIHSLRAVPLEAILELTNYLSNAKISLPIHIHIAEQIKEVEDCLKSYGARPVEWLLNHINVNHHWCLIHATHLSPSETRDLAKSGAVVGLCPTTEGNLGDGIFPLKEFQQHEGRITIGSDSHVSISPVEELRWLEYTQRMLKQQRNICTKQNDAHCGQSLLNDIWQGGALACGLKLGKIAIEYQADIIILDEQSFAMHTSTSDTDAIINRNYILDNFIFNGNQNRVRDVMVAGQWHIQNFHHSKEQSIYKSYQKLMAKLLTKINTRGN